MHVIESSNKDSLVPPFKIDAFGNKVDLVTGGRVWSENYYIARKDADLHAQQRSLCFEKSKEAFENGDKKLAKELSEEGKKHGLLMEEANKRAVDEILSPQQLETNEKIDLHGLLVNEAVTATRLFVQKAIERKQFEKLEIITGAGNHSDKNKGAAIKPAIIELCKGEKWPLESQSETNEGSFYLYLSKVTSP